MRIGIVNATTVAVDVLRRVIGSAPGLQLAWTANDGAAAVQKCSADPPDLVLMDLYMPVMDGAEATRQIMASHPCCILIVTATVDGHSSKVFEALGHGAVDAINTPALGADGTLAGAEPLLRKIARLQSLMAKNTPVTPAATSPAPSSVRRQNLPYLIVIGSSTGGPNALAKIIGQFPADFPAATVIVQHIDAQFAPGMANWLDQLCALPVELVREHDRPQPGKVLLAATNHHLVMTEQQTFQYCAEPRDNPYCPSADVFFRSVKLHWPRPGAAVILTGIGRDGAAGLLELRNHGWQTFAQDQASCVVYGMPKAAFELGAVRQMLAPEQIGAKLKGQP